MSNKVKKSSVYSKLLHWNWINAGILSLCLIVINFLFSRTYPSLKMLYLENDIQMSFIQDNAVIFMSILSLAGYFVSIYFLFKKPNKAQIESELSMENDEYVNIKKYNHQKPELYAFSILLAVLFVYIFSVIIPGNI